MQIAMENQKKMLNQLVLNGIAMRAVQQNLISMMGTGNPMVSLHNWAPSA